jgi:hypothetical protein
MCNLYSITLRLPRPELVPDASFIGVFKFDGCHVSCMRGRIQGVVVLVGE